MGALKNLWHSEKGLAGGLLIVAATVLVGLGHMTSEVWVEYTKWIFGIFVAGKTVQGAVATISGKPAAEDEPKGVVSGEIKPKEPS
jgi:uncharacterized membrane protein YkgB